MKHGFESKIRSRFYPWYCPAIRRHHLWSVPETNRSLKLAWRRRNESGQFELFNRDSQEIPEGRRKPILAGMSGEERLSDA
jgi:hypothetical protein